MPPERLDADVALDRFWDDVVLGQALDREGVDPLDAVAIGRLHQVALPAIDPGFRRRLRRDLLRGTVNAAAAAPIPTPAGRTPPQQPLRWAASAAVLVGLLSVLVWGLLLPWRQAPEQLIAVPAIDVSPAQVATPATPDATVAQAIAAPRWRFTDARDPAMGVAPGVTVAPNGNIWVTDGVSAGFQILSPEGQLIDRWGSAGQGDGEFVFAAADSNVLGAVAFRPDGGFYVADSGNRRVQQFTANREFVRAWGGFGQGNGQFAQPVDVDVDAQGDVYVTDLIRNDVQKFDADGAYLLTFGGFGAGPGHFQEIGWGALDAQGNFWAPDSGNHRIQQFAPDGEFLRAIGPDLGIPTAGALTLDGPQGVAIDATGRIFIADTGNARIVVLTLSGSLLGTFGEGALEHPVALALADDGALYALDDGRRGALQAFRLDLPETASP